MSIYVCKNKCTTVDYPCFFNIDMVDPLIECPNDQDGEFESLSGNVWEMLKVMMIDFDGRNEDSGMNSGDSPFMKQVRKMLETIE